MYSIEIVVVGSFAHLLKSIPEMKFSCQRIEVKSFDQLQNDRRRKKTNLDFKKDTGCRSIRNFKI